MQIEENIINNKKRECMQTNDGYIPPSSTSVDNMFSSYLTNMKDTLHYYDYLFVYNDHRK
jgi:hypothetical protein